MSFKPDGGAYADAYRKAAELLKSKKRIAALTHNTADGDTLGSGVAMCLALQKLNIEAALIYEEAFPDSLCDLFSRYAFNTFFDEDSWDFDSSWDAVTVFDTADPKLLGKRNRLLKQTGCVINIDHHISNSGYGDLNLVDAGASSTAEVVFYLINEFGISLDRDIALAIYTGVCTDTGGFSYSNTTSESHKIAAWALNYGLDVAHLRYKFFDAISFGKLHCHGYVANALKFYDNGRFAIAVVPASALAAIGASEADCEGLVNIGRNVSGVEVSALAKEIRPGEFRVNLRSRGDIDVAGVARKFDGGGHKLAAGCIINAAPHEVETIILNALKDIK